MFDHFVWLALKGLKDFKKTLQVDMLVKAMNFSECLTESFLFTNKTKVKHNKISQFYTKITHLIRISQENEKHLTVSGNTKNV